MFDLSKSPLIDHVLTGIVKNSADLYNNGYCFLCILNGEGHISFLDHTQSFLGKDIFFIPPETSCSINTKESAIIFAIFFNCIAIENALGNDAWKSFSQHYFNHFDYNTAPLSHHLAEIAVSWYGTDSTNDLHLQALVFRFLHYLEGYHKTAVQLSKPKHLTDKQFHNITQIINYIKANSSLPLSLNDTAKHFHMTPQYLSNFIKQTTGQTFFECLAHARLECAVRYVRYSIESDFRIAALSGFPNVNAFIKAFKEQYGCTPDVWREQLSIKNNGFISGYFSSFSSNELAKDYIHNYIPPQELSAPKSIVRNSQKIVLSANAKTRFKSPWKYLVNLGFTHNFSRADYRQQILHMQSLMNFEYGRLLRPFDIIHPISVDNQPMYDFGKLFRVLDFFYEVGLKPFLELGNKPYKININSVDHIKVQQTPDSDDYYENLLDILPHFLKSCINRYGYDQVSQWRFELWTEHLAGQAVHNQQSPETYAVYFSKIKKIIQTYAPDCKIGGPGYNTINPISHFEKFMTQLKAHNCLPDFVTAYIYPYISAADMPLTGEKLPYSYISPNKDIGYHRIKTLHAFCKEHYPDINDILITEYSAEVSSRNFINDSVYLATFIARFNTQCQNYTQALAYWPLSDISLEFSDSNHILFGGNGLINRNDIYKPGFYAHLFLNKMRENLIAKDEHYMLTSSMDNNHFDLLVFNYAHINDDYCKDNTSYSSLRNPTAVFEQISPQDLHFQIKHIIPGTYRIRHYIINNTYGNLLNEWIRLGITDYNSFEDIEYLKSNTNPHQEMFIQKVSDFLEITCHLSPQEIGIFAIDRMF